MKKKRFLKLVMSYGIQRDKAARMAARVGEFGSYEALFLSLRPSLAFWQMGATARRVGRTIRQAARAFGDMFAAMGTALAACFSPALRGYVDDAKEREQKQADFSAAGKVFLPSTHEIIAGAQPEAESTGGALVGKDTEPELQQAAGRRKAGLNMAKMSMRVILKSGAEFTVKCDKFTLERNGLEQVTGYNISGITENKPVYLDFDEVAAIVRVLSDEADAPPEDGGNEE